MARSSIFWKLHRFRALDAWLRRAPKPLALLTVVALLLVLAVVDGTGAAWARCRGAGDARRGIDATFPDSATRVLLRRACRGDAEGLAKHVSGGADIDARGAHGMTPLLWAVVQRERRAVTALLAAGADPDLSDDDGHPSLQWALRDRDDRMLRALLAHGADPDARTHLGEPVLLLAIDEDRPHYADLLLDAGADVNAATRSGDTAALRAASYNQFDWVARLIGRGADPFHADHAGATIALYVQENAIDPTSPRAAERDRMRDWLVSNGVSFPVPRPWECR